MSIVRDASANLVFLNREPLGDRAGLALAERLAAPVLTADRAWARLDLAIEVRLLRG